MTRRIKLNATEDNRITTISIIRDNNSSVQNDFECQNNMAHSELVCSFTEPSVYYQR